MKHPRPSYAQQRLEARQKREAERPRTAAGVYAQLGLSVEELDAAVIDDMREGGAKALQLFGRRIRESIEENKGSEVMRQFLREFGASLERGLSPAKALDLPPGRGNKNSQRAFERDNDAAIYYRLCVKRGMPKREAKARTADAFHFQNIDRTIRNSELHDLEDGPDYPVKNDSATEQLIAAGKVTAESGNSWDRYFAAKYPAIWRQLPLPQRAIAGPDKN